MIQMSFGIPPSVGHCYWHRGNGKILTDEARDWKETTSFHAQLFQGKRPRIQGKAIVEITVFWKNKRRRDCDNLLKLTLDALKGICFEDDCMALPRFMDFSIDKERPRIEVKIYEKDDKNP